MHRRWLLVFATALLLNMPLNSCADALTTRLTPGGIYVGQVDPSSRLFYQDQEVMIGTEGRFVLGFGRDAPLDQHYRIVDKTGQATQVSLRLEPREYRIETITGVAHKYVTPPEKVLTRIRQEATNVRQARTGATHQSDFFQGFDWPITGPITGVYGSQRIYNNKPGRPHYGLDIAAAIGTKIQAPASGVIKLAHPDLYYSGGTVIIDHGFGLFSSFLHLSRVSVKEGQTIQRGQIIGAVGATGRVTGAHLDWRYNWFEKRLDPQLLTLSQP